VPASITMLRFFFSIGPLVFLILCPLFAIFYFNPFWGLMDDGHLIFQAEQASTAGGYLRLLHQYTVQDVIHWGMLRPFYPALILALFSVYESIYAYFLNFAAVLCSVILLIYSILKSPWWNCFEKLRPAANWKYAAAMMVVFLGTPWSAFLFSRPSLQEKLVYIGAAVALFWVNKKSIQKLSLLSYIGTGCFVLLIGFCTKAQFIFFLPLVLTNQIAHDFYRTDQSRSYRWARSAALALMSGLGAITIFLIGKGGEYTSSYDSSMILINLQQSRAIWLFMPFGLAGLVAGFTLAGRGGDRWIRFLLIVSPVAGMFLFLLLMLPWRLGGYLYTGILPFLVMIAMIMIFWMAKFAIGRQLQSTTLVLVGLLAGIVSFYQTRQEFAFLGGIRSVIYSEETRILAEANVPIYVANSEGADHIKFYLKRYGGIENPKIVKYDLFTKQQVVDQLKNTRPQFVYWFADKKFNPIPWDLPFLIHQGTIELTPARYPTSYRLFKVPTNL